jgi:BirA family biotin operon repressor/biotin-[acetyl-CoA-carboxylase] ligase
MVSRVSGPDASSADPPSPLPARFTVLRVESTGSTNADLLERATNDPNAADLVLVAEHQRAGRGRLGRRWEAPPGVNLLASILFRPGRGTAVPPDEWHRYMWAVGLAASQACQLLGVDARLKWPNDLVVAEAKVAGLLAESRVASDPFDSVVVVGIGLNVGWPVGESAGELAGATSLAACGVRTSVDAVLAAIVAGIDEHAEGLAEAVRAHSATLRRAVRVERSQGPLYGTADSLADDGGLVVVDDAGVAHLVHVGDVIHLRSRDGDDPIG